MAVTENSYTGNGSTTNYSFTFPYLKSADVEVQVDATVTTAWTFANATTVQFNTAPANGAKIKILRNTTVDNLTATFYAGSAIKSEDLNDNFTQNLYVTQEIGNRYFATTGGTMTGDLSFGEDVKLTFEGATDNAHETILTVADPTADRTITLPDTTGTVVTTGDTGTVTATMLAANSVDSSELVDGSIDSSHIADDQINSQHYAAGSIDLEHMSDNSIDSNQYVDGSIDGVHIANDAIDSQHYAAGSIDLEHMSANSVDSDQYVDGSIDSAHIANDAIDSQHYAAGSIDLNHMSANSIDSDQYVDGSIDSAHIANDAIDSQHYAAGSIDLNHMSANSIDSDQYVDGSIDSAHIANNAIDSQHYATGSIDNNHMAANSIDSDQYVDGSIDRVHLAADIVDGTKIADNSIDSEHYIDGSIDREHLAAGIVDNTKLADNAVLEAKIQDNAVTTAKIADAELTTLAGMQSGTASILAGGTALTATLAEINAVVDGKTVQTTISDTDASYPTSGAVVDYVAAQIAPLGGLEVIATEVAFPNTQPSAGVVISISDAGGVVFNGSGVSTTGRTLGGSTVTINGAPSSLNSETLAAGVGLMVSSTGSSQTYNYHKILGKEDDIKQLSDDINDFNERYRIASSAPSSSLHDGDLWYDTSNAKMMVYSGTNSQWEEVSSTGDFYINTISSYSGTGGNSATLNGTAYRFVLSNPPGTAQQLVVSVNGVIQKPNSGTSQPSEGFAIDGSSIIFSAAPPNGADYFIITIGSTVAIGTPSNNTISTDKLQNLAVTDAKIANDTISEGKLDIHNAPSGTDKYLKYTANGMEWVTVPPGVGGSLGVDFNDNVKARFGTGNDLEVFGSGTMGHIVSNTDDLRIQSARVNILNVGANETLADFNANGAAKLYFDNSLKFETTSTGTTVTGILRADEFRQGDNEKIRLGNSEDLEIYHDGTNSQIQNSTGQIRTQSDWRWDDNKKVLFGYGDDFQIYHDGTNNHLKGLNGSTYIGAVGNVEIRNTDSAGSNAEWMGRFIEDGGVELYYDNSKKFHTRSDGTQTTGICYADRFHVNDSELISLGDSSDLTITHDGTHNVISCNTDKNLRIVNHLTGGNESMIVCDPNGAVELYYNGLLKFSTDDDGWKSNDNVKGLFGNGEDLILYSDGTNGLIRSPNGRLYLQSDTGVNLTKIGNTEAFLVCDADGTVKLYHNDTNRLQTTSSGVTITGTCTATSFSGSGASLTGISGTVTTGGNAGYWGIRAWGAFNGTNGGIHNDGNLSSITRHGSGDFTFNFSSTMPTSSYSFGGTCRAEWTWGNIMWNNTAGSRSTSSCRLYARRYSTGADDSTYMTMQFSC